MESCNNTSVGILVVRDNRLLLIERRNPPYGWAPPAGHVDDGETYAAAACRELREEVGLDIQSMRLVLERWFLNPCRRPGGDHHRWQVYSARTVGDPVRSEKETRAMRWVTRMELAVLRERGRALLAGSAGVARWREQLGLEPVWINILDAVPDSRWW